MSRYFEPQDSIFEKLNDNIDGTLEVIANSYIGRNPAAPFTFRNFRNEGFLQRKDGRYDMNLNEKFPKASLFQYGYVFGMFWCDGANNSEFALNCYCPTTIYVNRKLLHKASIDEEVNWEVTKKLHIRLQKGWNSVFIKFRKTASGFGGIFGTSNTKWNPMHAITPFSERAGQSGWLYSEVVNEDIFKDEESIPDCFASENLSQITWYPKNGWDEEQEKQNPCTRIFGAQSNKTAYMWSAIQNTGYNPKKYSIKGSSNSEIKFWLDECMIFSGKLDNNSDIKFEVPSGKHDIFVELGASNSGWDYNFDLFTEGSENGLTLPCDVKGAPTPWLYLGPFNSPLKDEVRDIKTLYRLFEEDRNGLYWRLDAKEAWVRPYSENPLFAKWNYPLGVTLYGLVQTGRVLEKKNIVDYVEAHIKECSKLYEYSVWDEKVYGCPSINNQLVELNMLDDCGSFGSAMLETFSGKEEADIKRIAAVIADHMENKQERREDGAFYRIDGHKINERTMWVDDLYMSTPFLTRYYKMTGDRKYIDDAARQFALFKKYLFIPEYKIMSHVHSFKYNTATYVPWGRGNGWAFFSLSEVLAVLPEDHERRGELLAFFNELAEGYMALQGKNGLWHQVLNRPDSYEETSCTSMFVYGLSRAIRFGWCSEANRDKAANAVNKGWEGLTKYSIDKLGNVHGVCRGSGYSFTPDYYKDELLWITNDTHGIGIVLLAGIEKAKMESWLAVNA